MKLKQVLQLLETHGVKVQEEKIDGDGNRTIVVGCALPMMPYGGRFVYSTLVLSPNQDEVSLEEREALKRRLCHLTTDIFGDDPELCGLLADPEEEAGSHLHNLIPKV
jgi:hypothetical protein